MSEQDKPLTSDESASALKLARQLRNEDGPRSLLARALLQTIGDLTAEREEHRRFAGLWENACNERDEMREARDRIAAEADRLRANHAAIAHIGRGRCPSIMYTERRDPSCPACNAMAAPR